MKVKWLVVVWVLAFAIPAFGADTGVLQTPKDKVDYAIGVDMARNMAKMGVEINVDILAKGMRDGFSGKNILMSDDEIHQVLTEYQTEMKIKHAEASKLAAQGNKKAGDAFMAENKAKEGVVTLPSGLQYKVIKAGNGQKPTEQDSVECNYRGTFVDGTEFDSSKGHPVTLKLSGGVIQGFRDALLLMPEGSKWQVFIPPQLAYGERGAPPKIGPNSTLIFEIESVAIKK